MKTIRCVLILLLQTAQAQAGVIRLELTGVTFDAPDQFEPLSQEIIDAKWPNREAPIFAVGNEKATTTIAFDVEPQDISGQDLEALRTNLQRSMNKMIPGIEWMDSSIIEQGGMSWVYLEMTSDAVDTDIHNIMVIGGVGKEMIIFNFNSTHEEFPEYEHVLRESIRSIQLATD